MARYDDNYDTPNRQRDLVLSVNEFCFLQNKTNGTIKTYTGPITMTISGQENLVVFDSKTKRFKETQDFEKARQLFVSAPEGWYIVLKNPAIDGTHPELAKAVNSPELEIGHKINIPGPVSFSLFPGQMTRVIRGHRLRSNQYLIARVYDADAAKNSSANATVIDAEGNTVQTKQEDYFVGQLLVIKGTEVSFYIPPTGIEVIPLNNDTYVRDAVTLERLEYAILKDEDGEKRYIHGPAVVFPQPTETFVTNENGNAIFKALELSPISGIYVKVIAEYEENGLKHPIGEELFITGKDQMIYYPRPEHAIIKYGDNFMHHAIAIPEGEGRYILNRLTGEIRTIKGPRMYLPDPRIEVVVKRKLTKKECELMYPSNQEVLAYNTGLVYSTINSTATPAMSINCCAASDVTTFKVDSLTRNTTYTEPRSITLDTKFDGVVSIDVWTGYAINIVSKSGKREVVAGPTTRLLDYDETIEAIELSTGKPKTTDKLLRTGFLQIKNNKISDIVNAKTSDFVDVQVKISYCVNFLDEYKDKWFNVENYVKYLTDHMRSVLKQEIKKKNIQEFVNNSTDIVRAVILGDSDNGYIFEENGMNIYDVDVLSVYMDDYYRNLFISHQDEIIQKTLDLANAEAKFNTSQKLIEFELQEAKLQNEKEAKILELKHLAEKDKLEKIEAIRVKERAMAEAKAQAEYDMQETLNAIQTEVVARQAQLDEAENAKKQAIAEIEKYKQEAYAATVKTIIDSIGPDLVAALTTKANADLLITATDNMTPYAMAKGESVADTVNTLLRGTSLEGILDNISK